MNSTEYVSADSTVESMHPYALSAKIQTHKCDTPTYKDIFRLLEEEGSLWDDAMIKELQSLRKFQYFEMVSRSRGANVLESIWAFKKKRYPDGGLKMFRARFCVREGQ